METPIDFKISSESRGGARVISVAGDLDLSTHEKLGERLVEEAGKGEPVIVDLAKCGFIDSSGLRSILIGLRASGEKGSGLSVAAPGPQVRRILEMTGLDQEVEIHDSVDDALAAVA